MHVDISWTTDQAQQFGVSFDSHTADFPDQWLRDFADYVEAEIPSIYPWQGTVIEKTISVADARIVTPNP